MFNTNIAIKVAKSEAFKVQIHIEQSVSTSLIKGHTEAGKPMRSGSEVQKMFICL